MPYNLETRPLQSKISKIRDSGYVDYIYKLCLYTEDVIGATSRVHIFKSATSR